MFSKLFGGSSKSSRNDKSSTTLPHNNNHSSYPPPAAVNAPLPSQSSRPSGDYDDVQLDGQHQHHSTTTMNGDNHDDGSFVGGGGGGGGSSYPPLPSFSRPVSSTTSHHSHSRYPPVSTTLHQLSTILDQQSPTLLSSLAPPLSPHDPILTSLRNSLSPYTIPSAVLDSYFVHDGQDTLSLGASGNGGGSNGLGGIGLVWGLWWMPLERVEEEWKFWRKLEKAGGEKGLGKRDPFSASSSSGSSNMTGGGVEKVGRGEEDEQDEEDQSEEGEGNRMSSFPPGWVRKKYSHRGWLPLLTDHCGNYIGVDLDPPSPSSLRRTDPNQKSYGQAGQVIAFGREIDEKVVLFPGDGSGGWARFLASFVEDVEKGEFARLGERPVSFGSASSSSRSNNRGGKQRASDEESLSGGDGSGSDGSGEGDNWEEDGLGERGYFEAYGTYGEDVVDGVRGDSRSANTWVLRSQFRRLAGETEGGLIGLIAERSRRKWRSLGVGSAQPRPHPGMSPRGALSVVVPVTQASSSTGVDVEEEPASAMTMRPSSASNEPPSHHPLSPNPSESPEVVLSPPSPKGTNQTLPPPLDTTSTPPTSSSSPRNSQDSQHRGTGGGGGAPTSPDGFLRDPPRAYKASQRQGGSGGQPRARRAPPPPPAPISVPIFSDLDFSESGSHSSSNPNHLSSSSMPDDSISSSTSALTRLSFSSQRSGERTPTTPQHLLPTSRSNSFASEQGNIVRPQAVRPTESSTSISMMNEFAERSTTALVPGRDVDDDSIHLGSPTLGPPAGGVEVVVQGGGGETGSGLKRVASPLDSPYEEQSEFAPPIPTRSPQLSGLRSPTLA